MNVGEILGVRLLSIHNLYRYREFMREIRSAIEQDAFAEYEKETLARLDEGVAQDA